MQKKINPLSPKRANFRYFSSCKILKNKWDYAKKKINPLSPKRANFRYFSSCKILKNKWDYAKKKLTLYLLSVPIFVIFRVVKY